MVISNFLKQMSGKVITDQCQCIEVKREGWSKTGKPKKTST